MKNTEFQQDIVQHAIDGMEFIQGGSIYGCDLHHILFNTDFFIIGYYEAEEWLKKNVGIFEAIREVQDYERFNFGETYTDISSSEKLCNMYTYIEGERLLNESKTLQKRWDKKLTDEDIETIIKELEEFR